MKVNGTATLNAPRERVFEALNDPKVLVRTIPGCHQLDAVGEASYRMTISAGVASIKGTYQGDVSLDDLRAPESFVMRAAGAGAPGTVSADVRVTLAEAGENQTRLDYEADATVGGVIGGVGQRVLSGVAKKTANEFFSNVDDLLTGKLPAADVAAHPDVPAGAEGPTGAAGASSSGQSFTLPAGSSRTDTDALLKGTLIGALIALIGVGVGGVLAGRRR